MFRLSTWLLMVTLASFLSPCLRADDEIFSGPQPGEKLVGFQMRGVLGEQAGQEIDLVKAADGKPLVIIFVHEVTRPSVGLTRTLMAYCAKRAPDGLQRGVVFLSDDPTETENWMKRASGALPPDTVLGISVDGVEGPGAYGLNRHVTMTVLVGKDNQVTANFALVQPSLQVDAPKVAKAIVDVLGGGPAPSLSELLPDNAQPVAGRMEDPQLERLLRAVIRTNAEPDAVKEAAAKLERYIAENAAAKRTLAEIIKRIGDAGKLQDYGTPTAQEFLRKWSKELDEAGQPAKRADKSEKTSPRVEPQRS